MAYADYAFYSDIYKGESISEGEFDRLITRASSYIDRVTSGRASSSLPEGAVGAVQMAACAVAEAWQTNEQGGELMSQTVGSWSRTFAAKAKSRDARLYDAVALYLAQWGLLGGWL